MKRPDLPKKKLLLPGVLALIAIGIHFFAADAERVENRYSTGVYPIIASTLRNITGWLPFSVGDTLYIALVVYIIWKIVRSFRIKWWKQKAWWVTFGINFISITLYIYIIFNILWGINYNRKGIGYQMQFERKEYTVAELQKVNELLAMELNSKKEVLVNHKPTTGDRELLRIAENAYLELEKKYPFFKYENPSVKPSLISWLGNYWGFSGYYNPLTGEAQINTDVPQFTKPFVAMHEIAHQLGYAKENEANFAGYIAAVSSGNDEFMYSAFFDLFLYANRNLRRADSTAAQTIVQNLHPAIKQDLEELKQYHRKYQNPVEPLIRWIYGKFLQANAQPGGMMSYNEVVADLIGYYNKYGTIIPSEK